MNFDFQIEKVFVGSLHERFVSDPRTIIDLSAFEPMSEQDAPFEEVLKKPVRFTYENGKVDNFETTEDDPSWSINIKRSILSTFHLSLTEREEPKDEIRREYLKVPSTNKPGRKSTSDDTDDDELFTVVEVSFLFWNLLKWVWVSSSLGDVDDDWKLSDDWYL